MPDWNMIRDQFPLTTDYTYLDTASVGPTPPFISNAINEFFQMKAMGSIIWDWSEKEMECREQVAEYLGVDKNEILFTSNTTEGINTVANAVDWNPQDEIIISDVNFPSNVYPWIQLQNQNISVKILESEGGRLPISKIKSSITSDTRLISLPHVSMSTGYRVPLSGLRGIPDDVMVTLDGIQAMGCLRPNLEYVDGYAGALFKWLLGPFGMGILYLNSDVARDMTPRYIGYRSVSDDLSSSNHSYQPTSEYGEFPHSSYTLKSTPQKFQYSHINYPAIYCLSKALSFFNRIGWENIEDRIQYLSGYLYDELSKIDNISVVTDRTHRSGIIVFTDTQHSGEYINKQLKKQDIYVTQRGEYLRTATHVYNNQKDIDKLVKLLDELK